MTRTALIIGGGIGGLASARTLLRHGWRVEVHERSAALPERGTALAMWPHAMRALERIGPAEAVRRAGAELGRHAPEATLRLATGEVLLTSRGRIDPCMINRADLLAALADGVEIAFGSTVEAADGDRFDLVVGADGVHSATRRTAFGDRYAARSLGAVAWRGLAPGVVTRHGEVWAPGALFGMTPTGRDLTNYYACVYADAPFTGPQLPRLSELFGDWPGSVAEVLERLDDAEILHHELFESPKLPSFVRGHIALLGDAAHGMGPFLGRGACEALVDGVTLGACVGSAGSVPAGLAAYDRRRRRATQRLVTGSRLTGRVAMASTGLGPRNAAIRLIARLGRLRGAEPVRDEATSAA